MRRQAWILAAAMALAGCAHGDRRQAPDEGVRIAALVDPVIEAELAASGIPGAAFAFVRGGRIVHARGYGVADAAAGTPADAERTVWPVASITKTVTAIAALQLVERGSLDLESDVNGSLRRLQVPAQGHPPLTLRHLLSHTAGLDELPGRRFDGAAVPDLAGFLRGRLRRYRAPGLRTAYSTYGIALAGVLVEDASGLDYADYVREHIFMPAGMGSARIMQRRGDERGVATPYAIEDGRATAIAHEFYVTAPTSSMVASAADMGRLLIALREQGADRAILAAGTIRRMLSQQATIHPDLPGWGLGFQMDRVNGVRIAEHGGDIAGFSALLVLMPELDAGFFIVHHGEGGDLRFRVKQVLLDALHPAPPPQAPAPDSTDAPRLAEYAGRYLSSLACRSCPEAAENAFTLEVDPEGSLRLWGQRWLPLRRDLFIRDDGRRLLGFGRDAAGRVELGHRRIVAGGGPAALTPTPRGDQSQRARLNRMKSQTQRRRTTPSTTK